MAAAGHVSRPAPLSRLQPGVRTRSHSGGLQDRELTHMATALTSHLAATLMTMARNGHGVAWLPQTVAADDQDRGQLVRAGSEIFDVPIEIRLFRSLECRNQAADALWEHLSQTAISA